ncbi:MAG: ribonuclease D [Planctomycetota bacterium]|nr:ribonuclease D [Planctomycetota bacterium]
MTDAPEADTPEEPPRRTRLPTPSEHAPEIVADAEGLARLAEHVAGCAQVAIDTEANSMHAYREQTCILQATAGGRTAIVDVLAVPSLRPLREALDRSDVEIIFHGGDYDITVLTRDHDFRFDRVFDTMIAATLLGDDRLGLAALVEDHFGDTLDKRYQRADWARRPLTAEQVDYLRRDTMYLPALRAEYGARLRAADLDEEAAIEFRRLSERRGTPAIVDPEGWRRMKGARKLDETGRAILHALHGWREAEAERRDSPPFKVFPPQAMLALAEGCKREPRHARDLPGVPESLKRRYGAALLACVRAGLASVTSGAAPAPDARPRLSSEEALAAKETRRLDDALRDWRRKEAKRRKVPTMVVLPNPALVWMIQERPTTVAELAACPDLGSKRADRYGVRWIELLT